MTKELLVWRSTKCLSILVPKRRGAGFAKQPFGHHVGPLSEVERQVGYDLWGLDGSLDVQTGRHTAKADIATILEPICAYYGMPWREIGVDEWYNKNPCRAIDEKENLS